MKAFISVPTIHISEENKIQFGWKGSGSNEIYCEKDLMRNEASELMKWNNNNGHT